MKNRKKEWLTQAPIAHRGYHWIDGVDENTFEAFEQAKKRSIAIECDLHLSRDGEVFIHHDEDLFRMTGVNKKISELDSSELRLIRTTNSERGVLSLTELLSLVDSKVPLVLELKKTRKDYLLEREVLKTMKTYFGEYSLQSFHPLALLYLRKNDPNVIIGQLSGDECLDHLNLLSKILVKSMSLAHMIRPDYLAYECSALNSRAPQELREKLGIPLLAWTVEDQKTLSLAQRYADNFIYENIDKYL